LEQLKVAHQDHTFLIRIVEWLDNFTVVMRRVAMICPIGMDVLLYLGLVEALRTLD
jgi:hypothetical protein